MMDKEALLTNHQNPQNESRVNPTLDYRQKKERAIGKHPKKHMLPASNARTQPKKK
eukprot:CAMPEP_0194388656 /NCGR_PEP_ID=MMETSP0174-20130528/99763_1 /TAXON_ID=216777 /ORGANISM="Proboscia alata, Strain PI-D3" /LENGTH=55 /DNA_ID=CAMNT_0039180159 /DNA_START=46 /DNA_END=210 /DNA_ORIENTATION=-